MSDSSSRPRRKLRNSTACDHCHRRRIRCRESSTDPNRCHTCADFDLPCTYQRPIKRGKGKLRRPAAASPERQLQDALHASPPQQHPFHQSQGENSSSAIEAHQVDASGDAGPSRPPPSIPPRRSPRELAFAAPAGFHVRADVPLSRAWKSFAIASTRLVHKLLDVYHETVYPIFPFFDRQYTQQRLVNLEHASSPGFFCSVMAACALASARLRDGAVISSKRDHTQIAELLAIPAETFYAAAEEALPGDLLQTCEKSREFEFLRACGLLAIASIQEGRIDAMQKFMGYYFTMLAVQNGHDEQFWPQHLTRVELEERRRLYWSIYTLDVYSSIVWDGCIHFQEGHSKVLYPEGDIFHSPNSTSSHQGQGEPPWIIGWNFTTNLYRYLEHFVARLRTQDSVYNLFQGPQTTNPSIESERIFCKVMAEYEQLPDQFKQLREATEDPDSDIYGFQSANIHATMALLRMMLYTLEGKGSRHQTDIGKKCQVAQQVLSTFRKVPLAFWRAISTPLIYHIASIGALLWSAMQGPLSDTLYQRVRTLLLEMAELLQNMEAFLSRSAGEGQRLRDMVAKFDEWFRSRRERHGTGQHDAALLAGSGGGGGLETANNNIDVQSQAGSQVGSHGGELVNERNGQGNMDELSPQFQLPDELLLEWTWPADISQAYLPGGVYSYLPIYGTGPYGESSGDGL